MFTGIVREVGQVREITHSGDTKIRIGCKRLPETIDIGASIACSGVCLTVVARGADDSGPWFSVDASTETRARTNVGDWTTGTPVNLEPALRIGDELGGHIVSGHVDGVGALVAVMPEGDSHRMTFSVPTSLGRFIARKGSVTIDGISLTVNEVEDKDGETRFGVNIIPHTWTHTTLGQTPVGARVNLEIDLLARYVARLAEAG
jgi:riboflavin synthase